jgi:hypothetical protein
MLITTAYPDACIINRVTSVIIYIFYKISLQLLLDFDKVIRF